VSYSHDAQPSILGKGFAAMKASTICKKQEIVQAMKETMHMVTAQFVQVHICK
jgi:hypothetical protein